tara:strand:- start:744 stop:1781 length:1038 start_codon:yes stop_codon:yes gene_type:complete
MAFSTINKSSDFMNPVTYAGNGSTQSVTGVNFQADLTWIKNRDATESHVLFDVVRGVQKAINSNTSDSEATSSNYLTAWGADGFSVGASGLVNDNGNDYISWNWKANGSGVSNSNGSITSTVSANATSGFSVVKYTGTGSNATVGHGLSVAPKMILIKDVTNSATNWSVYNKDIGAGYRLTLNSDAASQGSDSTYYQNTDPTSSFFYIGTNTRANASGAEHIAYCFAEIPGYSTCGQYTGNGDNGDGPFIATPFAPQFILIKRTDNAGWWVITDTKRLGYNVSNPRLYPNSNTAEDPADSTMNLLSNGFKLISSSQYVNASSGTYIYMAFGQPLTGSNDITNNAR